MEEIRFKHIIILQDTPDLRPNGNPQKMIKAGKELKGLAEVMEPFLKKKVAREVKMVGTTFETPEAAERFIEKEKEQKETSK